MTDTYQSKGPGDEIVDKEDLLIARLDRLEELIVRKVIVESRWKLEDVANFMQVHPATARRVLAQPGAPLPCRPPSGEDTRLAPRYVPSEIKEWFEKRVNRAS